VLKLLCDLLSVFLPLIFLKSASQKARCSKSKIKVNELNWSDKVKLLDLSKGGMSIVEVGWGYGKMKQSAVVQHWSLCILSICSFLRVVSLETYACGYLLPNRRAPCKKLGRWREGYEKQDAAESQDPSHSQFFPRSSLALGDCENQMDQGIQWKCVPTHFQPSCEWVFPKDQSKTHFQGAPTFTNTEEQLTITKGMNFFIKRPSIKPFPRKWNTAWS
jgi:hypothetical protein